MCSTAGQSDLMRRRVRKEQQKDRCFKCEKTPPIVVIRQGDPFCGACLEQHLIRKFRQGLGKTKILYPGETVLLDVSGSASSLVMLQLMSSGYNKASHKRTTATPVVLVVDESRVWEVGESVVGAILDVLAHRTTSDMPQQVLLLPLEIGLLPGLAKRCREIYQSAASHDILDFGELSEPELVERAQDVLGRDIELRGALRRLLITELARALNCRKVMLPSTSSEISSRLLSAVATGRGSGVPFECNYLDTRLADVTFINCMREFTLKECVFFLRSRRIPCLTLPGPAPGPSSILQLTEKFIAGLQAEFPSTVSTVLRTAAKLEGLRGEANCGLCALPCEGNLCHGCEIIFAEGVPQGF